MHGRYHAGEPLLREFMKHPQRTLPLAAQGIAVGDEHNLLLREICRIRGRGSPLPGLSVKAYRYENGTWRWRRDAIVQADGSYTLNALREGTYRVSFYDPGGNYIREWWEDVTTIGPGKVDKSKYREHMVWLFAPMLKPTN